MKTIDNVSPELRKIEKEIDNYYKSNPLVKLPFATAAWSLLAYAENSVLMEHVRHQLTSQELEIMGDNFVNELKAPMVWLLLACKPDGQIPVAYDHKVLQASRNLFRLGKKYQWFEEAYTYASRGWIKLELHESTIQPTKEFSTDQEYRAYARLMKVHESDEAVSLINIRHYSDLKIHCAN